MSSNEVKVGAVTLVGAGLLAGIITFLGAFTFAVDDYQLQISYPQVGGLQPGNVVRYAGVQAGTVKEITVKSTGVNVIADINKEIKIPQGAKFSLGTDGILGAKFVDIIPPSKMSGQYIPADAQVQGTAGQGLDEFMAASAKVLSKVEGIAEALNNVFGDQAVQQSLRDGFINMRDISDNMNTFTKVMSEVAVENQSQINVMIKQMSTMSERMNGVASHMENIMAEVDQGGTGKNIAKTIENIAKTSGRIEQIAGTLEKVVKDPETEKDLKATLHNAREASEKANKMLGVLDSAKVRADVTHNAKGSDWRSNLGVTLTPQDNTFVYLGGYDIGDSNKLDLQFGKRIKDTAISAGAMQGEFGVGLDYNFSDRFKVFTQVYDFNDTKVKVGGELKLTDNFSLLGEQMDVRHGSKNNTYVGVRSYF